MKAFLELLGGSADSPSAPGTEERPVLARFPLGVRPLHVGRAPDNDVVLTDETVSAYHLSVWWQGEEVWVRDRRSRNGTLLAGQVLKGEAVLAPGALLRVGLGTWMSLRLEASSLPAPEQPLMLEMVNGGLCIMLSANPTALGRGRGADVLVDVADDELMLVHQDGPLAVFWTERAGRSELAVGASITIGGQVFRLQRALGLWKDTVGRSGSGLQLHIRILKTSGVEAVVKDTNSGFSHRIEAENRAVFLYLLARRARDDRARGLDPEEAGWCSDEEVVLGVWGREGSRMEANNLHVLLHRLRRELKEAGLQADIVQKRRRAIRCLATEVTIHELPQGRAD